MNPNSFEELKRAIVNGVSSYDLNSENKYVTASVFEHDKNHGEKDAVSILFFDSSIDNYYEDPLTESVTGWEIYLYPDGTWEIC